MKKFIKILVLVSISFLVLSGQQSFAEEIQDDGAPITIVVTEKIPGAPCPAEVKEGELTGKYECQVPKGFGSIVAIMGEVIKYFTFIAGLGGVLFIVINGILYSMSGLDQTMKDKSKEKIISTLLGLVLLLLSGVVLNVIAPWIYK